MTLNETEVAVVNAVLQEFLSKGKPMERKPLLLKAKSREVLERLVRWGILKTDDQKTYLPTALSFHYAKDTEALFLARKSITILGQVLKTLYEGEGGDRRFRWLEGGAAIWCFDRNSEQADEAVQYSGLSGHRLFGCCRR